MEVVYPWPTSYILILKRDEKGKEGSQNQVVNWLPHPPNGRYIRSDVNGQTDGHRQNRVFIEFLSLCLCLCILQGEGEFPATYKGRPGVAIRMCSLGVLDS